MKKLSALIFLFFLTLASTVNAANFVEGMEDVPLMDGLSQITQDDISFGNEETRLLEAYLTSRRLKFAAVANFYRESLHRSQSPLEGIQAQSIRKADI